MRKKIVAIILGVAMLLSGCGKADGKVGDEVNINIDAVSEEEIPLSYENIEGLWFDGDMPFVYFDISSSRVTFMSGEEFRLDGVETDHLVVTNLAEYDQNPQGEPSFESLMKMYGLLTQEYYNIRTCSSIGKMNLPFKMIGDKLHFLERELTKESPKDSKYVEDLISEKTFYLAYGMTTVRFTKYHKFEISDYKSYDYEVDGYVITIKAEGDYKIFLREIGDDLYLTSTFGAILTTDRSFLDCEWLDLDGTTWSFGEDTITLTDQSGNVSEKEYSLNPYGVGHLTLEDGIEYNIVQEYADMLYIETKDLDIVQCLYSSRSYEYSMCKYRLEVLSGDKENVLYDEPCYSYNSGGDKCEIKIDIGDKDIKNVWLGDYLKVQKIRNYCPVMYFSIYSGFVGTTLYVTPGEEFTSADVTFAQLTSYNIKAEDLALDRYSTFGHETERRYEDSKITYEDGYLTTDFKMDENDKELFYYMIDANEYS